MAKVKDVARLFIDIAGQQAENGQGDGMTNLRLQKLLYFAQGWYMARYGKPLRYFDDRAELIAPARKRGWAAVQFVSAQQMASELDAAMR